MAAKGKWTVIFEDKIIIKNYDEGASEGIGYKILDDDDFWNDSKFSNIWAIQYGTSVSTDEVEYKDTTPHTTYTDANLGDISQFTSKWDAVHLTQLQKNWDNDGVLNETSEEKIARLGARPTSYTSS
jgi:hypothetical protein